MDLEVEACGWKGLSSPPLGSFGEVAPGEQKSPCFILSLLRTMKRPQLCPPGLQKSSSCRKSQCMKQHLSLSRSLNPSLRMTTRMLRR